MYYCMLEPNASVVMEAHKSVNEFKNPKTKTGAPMKGFNGALGSCIDSIRFTG